MGLRIETVLEREHGQEIRALARQGAGFGIMAGTGTGKTLAIRPIAEEVVRAPLAVGVVNREREATPATPNWNVVIVTTGIARRWFQGELIDPHDTLVVDEIHQTSAELELCLALGKRVGCRFVWLSATVDPAFYATYLESEAVLQTTAFDPHLAAKVVTRYQAPLSFLGDGFMRRVIRDRRGVAVFVPTRAEVEAIATELGERWLRLDTAFYHGGEPIRVIRPFLEGTAPKPFLLAMTAAGQSALNIRGLDTVVIYDSRFSNVVRGGRNVLTRQYLGNNELLQMAGRVHGRVSGGEVYILTEREIDFATLEPTPPEFQLAGDSERVALTAAALGVDLGELELPVPLDTRGYRAAVEHLTGRGVILNGRLTQYGRDVEAMPVDRPWGELLVQVGDDLLPCVAVMSNVDSLHRMTRDERDLRGLVVPGSDHLTAYNVYAEAVEIHGYLGEVYGLPRHLFRETLDEWAESRGVLVKAIEDIALGTASVYRTLERPLPKTLPRGNSTVRRAFQDLVAQLMPFDLVIDEMTSDGAPVRVDRGSVCSTWGAVAGSIRYFSDRFGVARGGIEGTNIPWSVIRRYARRSEPVVEFRNGRRRAGLQVVRRTEYFGFELERHQEPLTDRFPGELRVAAQGALTTALMAGGTPHPQQRAIRRALERYGEYWRRSGGKLAAADPQRTRRAIADQLAHVQSWSDFMETPLALDPQRSIPDSVRRELDALPSSAPIRGDRFPLDYEIENGEAIVRLRVSEGRARRLRERDLPPVDRPLRFTVMRGKRPALRADTLEQLRAMMAAEAADSGGGKGGRGRRRRR